jgi:hypothetical protein
MISMLLRLIVFLLAVAAISPAQEQPLAFHCAQDGDIDTLKASVIQNTATEFLRTIINGEPGAAWDTLTAHSQQSIPRAQFVNGAMLGVIAAQPRNLTLRHMFLIHVVGTPPPNARVTCGPDPADSEQSFNMTVAPALEQAYALFSADGASNELAFVLWIVRDQSGWRVNSFAANPSTLAGRSAQQLWQIARVEHQRDHDFNATLLYLAAAQLVQRGPDFSLGYASQLATEQAAIPKPKELSGSPPFTLEDHGKAFTLRTIGPSDVGGRLFLGATHEVNAWKSQKDADRLNRELISLIKRLFPEYSSAFAGIIVQGVERGTGRVSVTVEDQPSSR